MLSLTMMKAAKGKVQASRKKNLRKKRKQSERFEMFEELISWSQAGSNSAEGNQKLART